MSGEGPRDIAVIKSTANVQVDTENLYDMAASLNWIRQLLYKKVGEWREWMLFVISEVLKEFRLSLKPAEMQQRTKIFFSCSKKKNCVLFIFVQNWNVVIPSFLREVVCSLCAKTARQEIMKIMLRGRQVQLYNRGETDITFTV